jgi:nitrite reductase/ring-hydroxylating ferredoxin subunit
VGGKLVKPSDPPPRNSLWREDISFRTAEEQYVARRQFGKFLVLTSLGMFAGNLWILAKSWIFRQPAYPLRRIAGGEDIAIGGVKLFHYPGEHDPCILIRLSAGEYAAYSQKCTHLSCAVYYEKEHGRLECPCHEGYFSVRTGAVLQGPPPRPLPRVLVEMRDGQLIAKGMTFNSEEA